jgi:Methylamine utilisation protein MauE
MIRKLIPDVVIFQLIGLFVYAAASKMIEYPKFSIQVSLSPLLPAFSKQAAWLIPVSELFIVMLLLTPTYRKIGLWSSFILLFIFTLYIIGILTIADHVPCSCGGVLESFSWTSHLIFNIVFLILTALALVFDVEINTEFNQTNKNITDQ